MRGGAPHANSLRKAGKRALQDPERKRRRCVGWRPTRTRCGKQESEHFKIRSVSDGDAWGWAPELAAESRKSEHFKIRSVSDGDAWGWCPRTRCGKQESDHFKIRSVSDGDAWG